MTPPKVFLKQNFDNLDSSSDTSPSAPSLPSSVSQTVLTTSSRNVTTPPIRSISNSFDTSSTKSYSTSSSNNRPPISEIPITPLTQSQPSPIHTPLVHIPNPESVAKYINYKPQKLKTANEMARQSPQLDIVQIPEKTYNTELESSTRSQIYPTIKPLKKLSTSLSNLLDAESPQDYEPSDSNYSLYIPQHRYNFCLLPNRRLSTDSSTLNFSALSSSYAIRLLSQHAQ